MTGKQAGKPLSLKACTMTKSTDKYQAEPSKIRRLHAVDRGIDFQPLY